MAKNTYGRYFVGLIIVLSAFTSCSKKMTSPVTPKNLFTYSVTGLSDINILQYNDTVVYQKIKLAALSGSVDSLTVTFDSIPRGVTAIPQTYTNMVDFPEVLTMTMKIDTPGTYPVVLRTTSPSADTELHSFNIIVAPNADCSEAIAGLYTINTSCEGWLPSGPSQDIVKKYGPNIVLLPTPPLQGSFVVGHLNCDDLTFSTSAAGNASAGSGGYTSNTIWLTFDYIDISRDNETHKCYVNYKR